MAEKTLADIEQELASIDRAYEEGYSGKDRNKVDPSALEKLVKRTQAQKAELEKLGALTAGETAGNLLRDIEGRIALYEREAALIGAAREMGPGFEKFSMDGAAANFVFDRYNRHYAGQSRDTRDLGLLKELVEELRQIKKRMVATGGKKLPAPMARDLDLITQNIERYQAEEREIPRAQATGTPEEQANRYAFLANQQFAIYQAFFAGQARVTRRPQLLVRLTDNLKRYRAAMFDLKNRGYDSAQNKNNIDIVDGRIDAYEKELVEIRKTRSSVKLAEIMGVLGGAANDLFEEYRNDFANKDRAGVSLEQLAGLIDKLDELRRQMEELGRVEKNEMNAKNVAIVRDYQASWIREFQQVRAVQQPAPNVTSAASND